MKPRKILSMIMAMLMALSLLPSLVFAASMEGELGGRLKIKGTAAVGSVLSADYEKVTPEGITDDDVTFQWSRKIGEELTEVSKEKAYTLAAEDLGNKIVLKITGREEMGFAGELKANTVEIAATAEEAPAETTEEPVEELTEDVQTQEEAQDPAEDNIQVIDEEFPEDIVEENGEDQEMTPVEEPEMPAAEDELNEDVIDIGVEDSYTLSETEEAQPAEPEAPQAEPVYAAEAVIDQENNKLDFGTLDFGYQSSEQEPLYVTIRNTGNAPLNFNSIAPEHFMAQDIETPLEAGASVSLWVIPRDGVAVGTYQDTIEYTTAEGVKVSFEADMIVADPVQSVGNDENEKQSEEPVVEEPAAEEPAAEEQQPEIDPAQETPAVQPEEPAEPTEDPQPEEPAVVSLKADKEAVDFGSIVQGNSLPEAQNILLTNDGDKDINLAVKATEGFTAELGAQTVPMGESVELKVAPVAAEAGTYAGTIEVTDVDNADAEAGILCKVTASFEIKAQSAALTADSEDIDFGAVEAGYTEAVSAKVTVSNSGNVALNGLNIATEGTAFNVSDLSATELAPGADLSFTVTPVTGLAAGNYTQMITVKSAQGAEVSVSAAFVVEAAENKLTGIEKPDSITLNSGAEKSAKGLGLPSTIVIHTTNGDMKAAVAWDVKNSAYDPASREAQSFKVKGSVTLPDGVTNPDELNLIISVKVSVGRAVRVADTADNRITGISQDASYTTETKITFEAVGAGMDNEKPENGDTRYLPAYWEVLEARSWESAPYSATFRMGKTGTYTLTVTFNQQKFDGNGWVATGAQDSKQVNFKVAEAPNQTLTPAAKQSNVKNAVRTGDSTVILPFIVILVVAVILIVGILVYRKKK